MFQSIIEMKAIGPIEREHTFIFQYWAEVKRQWYAETTQRNEKVLDCQSDARGYSSENEQVSSCHYLNSKLLPLQRWVRSTQRPMAGLKRTTFKDTTRP